MLTEIFNHLSGSLPSEIWSGVEIAEDIDVLREMAGTVEDATVIIMP